MLDSTTLRCFVVLGLGGTVAGQQGIPRAATWSSHTRDGTANQPFGAVGQSTIVNMDVSVWYSGGGHHDFSGNLINQGQITISQTDYLTSHPNAPGMTVDYTGHDANNGNVVNNGSISLNDFGCTAASAYDWRIHQLSNTGTLQWCGRGDTGGSTYQLYCDVTSYNYGVISFEQYDGNQGASFVWRNPTLYGPGTRDVQHTYNYGAFRLVNVVYHNVQNVLGDGCYVIGDGGVLYLEDGSGYYQNPDYGPTFPNQKIYFTAATAVLHLDTQVYSYNSHFGPQLYGFGRGNAIEFHETLRTLVPFVYDATTGMLTVYFQSGNVVVIKLGLGYVPALLFTAANPTTYNRTGYNAIFYSGPTPTQAVPSQCRVSLGECDNPSHTAGAASSATSSPSGKSFTASTSAAVDIRSYVTITSSITGVGTPTGTTTITLVRPSGTAPGTVEVVPVYPSFVTTTVPATGQVVGTSTVTVAQATGATPGTVQLISITVSSTSLSSSSLLDRPATIATTIGSAQCLCVPIAPF